MSMNLIYTVSVSDGSYRTTEFTFDKRGKALEFAETAFRTIIPDEEHKKDAAVTITISFDTSIPEIDLEEALVDVPVDDMDDDF